MKEEPKSIWKKSWHGPSAFFVLMLFAAMVGMLVALIYSLTHWEKPVADAFVAAAVPAFCWVVGCITIIYFLVVLRWLVRIHWRRVLFALACFATLITLFYAEENWRGWHDWNQFKQEWEAKGEHFDFASVVPARVPDDQNFALTPIVASSYERYFDTNGLELNPRNTNAIDRLSMINWRDDSYENKREKIVESPGWLMATSVNLKAWQNYFRTPPPTNSLLTNCYPVAPEPQTPADDVLLAVSKYASTIEEIRQASRLPYSRFPLTYNAEPKFGILLPHLAALKSSARAISLRAVAELQINQAESAFNDAKLGIYLANSLHTEPSDISQLVRILILENALQPVWEGLKNHRWSEAELIALDADLGTVDLLVDFQRVQKASIGFVTEDLTYLRRHRDFDAVFAPIGINYPSELRIDFLIHRYAPSGWFYWSTLRNTRVLLQYLPAVDCQARIISAKLTRQADEIAFAEARLLDPFNSLKKAFNNDELLGGNIVKKFAHGQAFIDLTRTAIALERFRLAHGAYPESLAVLAPQFIAQVPHDVMGGQPLKYRREADGLFTLYSIGWNETDDGGVVVTHKDSVDIGTGDWVWRYQAKVN